MFKKIHNSILERTFIAAMMVMCVWVMCASFNNPFELQVKIVKCYPNPATSVINFDFASKVDKTFSLQIYSFTGKKMADQSLISNKISIPLTNDFYRGIYIFQLRDKAGRIIETGKFQVVR